MYDGIGRVAARDPTGGCCPVQRRTQEHRRAEHDSATNPFKADRHSDSQSTQSVNKQYSETERMDLSTIFQQQI
jgi:hypothetical protein